MGYISTISINSNDQYLIEPQLFATAGGTSTALTAGINNFELVAGAYVNVKVGDVGANATLNVNNTGAKAIYYSDTPIKDNILSTDHIYTFIYDGTQWNIVGDITNNDIMIGTTAEWRANPTFIPPNGTIIIYTDYSSIENNGVTKVIPGIKVGDGITPGIDKAFVGEDVKQQLLDHINDEVRHITSTERTFWNNKINTELDGEVLVFNRS